MFKFMMDRMVGAAEYVVGSGIVGFYLVFVDPREGLASTEAELNPTPQPDLDRQALAAHRGQIRLPSREFIASRAGRTNKKWAA